MAYMDIDSYKAGYQQAVEDALDVLYAEHDRYTRRVNQQAGLRRGIQRVQILRIGPLETPGGISSEISES